MSKHVLAYLAGAMDSDGSFGIKKSTYHQRVRKDAGNAVYSERAMLKQVTPQIPHLLRDTFGGSLRLEKKTGNCKDLWSWSATDLNAAHVAEQLLPFLRVKVEQAKLLLELRRSKSSNYWQEAYWFELECPDWKTMPMLTTSEVMDLLKLSNRGSVGQAVKNGTILALPYAKDGRWRGESPRYPRALVERLAANRGTDGRCNRRPPALVAWREEMYQKIREMNKIGVNGTSVYFLTGHHSPAVA